MTAASRAILERYKLPLGIVFVILFTIFGQFLEFHGLFAGAESRISHFLLGTPSASSSSLPIAVIEIDDESYNEFFDRTSPLKPELVWSLIGAIATTFKPAVLGVDLLTEERAYRDFGPSPPTTKVVWAAGFREQPVPQSVHFGNWLLGKDESMTVAPGNILGRTPVKSDLWGIPFFDIEADGTVRQIRRTWTDGDGHEHQDVFARRIADAYCNAIGTAPQSSAASVEARQGCNRRKNRGATAEEFFFRESRAEPYRWTLGQLFSCPKSPDSKPCEWTSLFSDASGAKPGKDGGDNNLISLLTQTEEQPIVLLGGTYSAARDSYASLQVKGTPGVLLNARAVQIELQGHPIIEFPRLWSVVLDIVIGCAPLMVFWFLSRPDLFDKLPLSSPKPFLLRAHDHWRSRSHEMLFGALLLGAQIAVTVVLFRVLGSLWLSWVPALLSGFAWQALIETLIFPESHSSAAT